MTGTLFAGVIFGQLRLEISADVKQIFFYLFMFAIGFRVGPEFFRGLKRDGIPQAAVAALVCVAGLVVAYVVGRLFRFDGGATAGVIAGSLTSSPTIGTATDAISRLALPPERIDAMVSHVAVAYSVTYLIGVAVSAWFLAHVAPRLLRVDLAASCRDYESRMPGFRAKLATLRTDVEYRAYEVLPGSPLIEREVGELETRAADERLFVERLRRDDRLVDPEAGTVVLVGDVLAITGRRELLVPGIAATRLGLREVDDAELLAIPADAVDVVVSRADVDGRTLADLAAEEALRSVYLLGLIRSGLPVEIRPETTVQRGDVLKLVGPARRIARAASRLGAADRVTNVTDMALVGLALVAGALIAMPTIRWGSLEIGLGAAVGVLLAGVVCGSLRATRPGVVARIPAAALWLFESVGLAGFVAVVGLGAGPQFVAGLKASGLALVVAGLATTILPLLVGMGCGRWLFRMHPGVLLGVCAGGGGAAPALAAVQEVANSPVPALGYGVAFAVSNILLALWGSVIVAVM